MTSQNQSRCIATTQDASQCSNPAQQDSEYCHLGAHGPDSSQDDATEADELTPMGGQEWWYEAPETVLQHGVEEPWNGLSHPSAAVLTLIKGQDEDTGTLMADTFGVCKDSECDRGCYGFESDWCNKHQSEDDDEDDDGDGKTITVEVEGFGEVTGTPDDIAQLRDSL